MRAHTHTRTHTYANTHEPQITKVPGSWIPVRQQIVKQTCKATVYLPNVWPDNSSTSLFCVYEQQRHARIQKILSEEVQV